ncbi:TlpA family protein disulfide reductase [Qipengyuania spongiae]|uniref:TlpA family protein disulfide reductase n=1 Tax=Qipengyuania spongiae TaxID=2909673 RepID=A0ABY5T139_9SPHN|nr:TlpA disulfide reductase family protein [Qipengyuania spongiae]UVI40517.1 TlpA family protein disulfide reductase [Qipengyuania spongiae]
MGSAAKPMTTGEIDRSMAGELMPAVNLDSVEGEVLNLGALQGTPVLLNLWATWCAPCVKEMPLLDELAIAMDGEIRVVTASQDLGDRQKVADFFDSRDFRSIEPWLDPQNRLMAALDIDLLPTTIMYDAMGQEVWRVNGDFDWSSPEARAAVEEAIAPPLP